jgi:hypothetical protein
MDLSYSLRRLLYYKRKTYNLYKENPVVRGGKTLYITALTENKCCGRYKSHVTLT